MIEEEGDNLSTNTYSNSLSHLIYECNRKRKKILVLVGAGISVCAEPEGIPSLNNLFDYFVDLSIKNEEFCPEFKLLKSETLDEGTIRTLHQKVAKTKSWEMAMEWFNQRIKNARPTEAHIEITKLCRDGYIDYLLSLNYDDLFEKAQKILDLDIFHIILEYESLNRKINNPKRNKVPLIKAHGDLFTIICPKCRNINSIKFGNNGNGSQPKLNICNKCEYPLESQFKLPDSTRSNSESMIEALSFKAKNREFSLLICVGFSGKFDGHINQLILTFSKKYNVKVYNIDPHPSAMRTIIQDSYLMKIDANSAFRDLSKCVSIIKKEQDNEGLNLSYTCSYFDPIHSTINLTNIEQEICQKSLFRRLQGIRQLGVKYCKFIGANHNRFEHSLSVMVIADKMYMALKKIENANGLEMIPDPKKNNIERQLLRLAALLHDIGHVSMGHLAEEILKEISDKTYNHENYSKHILYKLMKSMNSSYDWPGFVPIDGNRYYTWNDLNNLMSGESGINVLDKIIKSTFDADKLEYLLRDSIMTGINYGKNIDIKNLVNNLIVTDDNYLVIDEAALSSVEAIAESRYHMYKEVYFDIDVRCYETIMKKLLKDWILGKVVDYQNPEIIEQYLFKNDQSLIDKISEEIDDINGKIFQTREHRESAKKMIAIIRGELSLPKRLLIEFNGNYDARDKIILDLEEALNNFLDQVMIDSESFEAYKSKEEPQILVKEYNIEKEGVEFKKMDLGKCSELIKTLSNVRNLGIRIYILDDTIILNVIETIKKIFMDSGAKDDEWDIKFF